MRPAKFALMCIVLTGLVGCKSLLKPAEGEKNVQLREKSQRRAAVMEEQAATAGPVDRMVINGEVVTADEVLRELRPELERQAASLPPDQYRAFLNQRTAQAISEKIHQVLVYEVAAARLSDADEQQIQRFVDEEIRVRVAKEFNGIQRRFERHLEAQGRTMDDAREEIRRELIIRRHLELHVKPKIPSPTRAELVALFEQKSSEWHRPPRASMSLIDVRIRDHLPEGIVEPTEADLAQARQSARDVIQKAYDEVRGGRPFADAAREYSKGLHAQEGGAWGWVSVAGVRDRFKPAVEQLYRLKAGEISDIIEVEDGFFLVRCDELDPGAKPDFEAVQSELRNRYLDAAFQRTMMDFIRDLLAEAEISPEDPSRFQAAIIAAAPRPTGG